MIQYFQNFEMKKIVDDAVLIHCILLNDMLVNWIYSLGKIRSVSKREKVHKCDKQCHTHRYSNQGWPTPDLTGGELRTKQLITSDFFFLHVKSHCVARFRASKNDFRLGGMHVRPWCICASFLFLKPWYARCDPDVSSDVLSFKWTNVPSTFVVFTIITSYSP